MVNPTASDLAVQGDIAGDLGLAQAHLNAAYAKIKASNYDQNILIGIDGAIVHIKAVTNEVNS